MEHDFWHARWGDDRTGFHEEAPNPLLVAHLSSLALAPGARVFVPLCGKSVDLIWLRDQGFAVVGAELSPIAVAAMMAALGGAEEVSQHGALQRYNAAGIEIFEGDIFALDATTLGAVDAVYDRAALVALPPRMRADYASHMVALTKRAPQLLISFAYDQAMMDGPPFSVPRSEITDLYGATHKVDPLADQAISGRLGQRCAGREQVWRLVPH
ncbi:Thiopurine S-methyltransferase [Candidatus Rhodobacter oscarellae]|uniref:Thiopurine S-methyltransferase n=1 Tax=Candidatus Rhodobacter oscarellae TaxID=1675527 RepID=A0A0J9E533_9RHOB|nr:thiopurine S-methyltransferase [Candidatus Rhodobacter lobularis]KMW57910.1 Thiopurine S-methyltransferase [Candidatus Rhodobacter lobularis]